MDLPIENGKRMKTIQNKVTNLKKNEKENLTFADLIQTCVNNVEKGITFSEMKKNFRILDVVEKAGEELQFEDDDFNLVKQKVNEMKWGINHREILEFCDIINK